MTQLPIKTPRPKLGRDFWRRLTAGLFAVTAVLNVTLAVNCYHQMKRAHYWEYLYNQTETVKNAALTACGLYADKCREMEAQLVMTSDIVIPISEEPVSPVSRYAPITDDEREMLARLVWLEARGEPSEGQQAVAEVVLNRVAAGNFPATVADVINQRGQFQPAALVPDATPGEAQYQAVDNALYGEPILPLDVVYFSVSGENDNVWGTIGGHVFCYQYGWEAGNG